MPLPSARPMKVNVWLSEAVYRAIRSLPLLKAHLLNCSVHARYQPLVELPDAWLPVPAREAWPQLRCPFQRRSVMHRASQVERQASEHARLLRLALCA